MSTVERYNNYIFGGDKTPHSPWDRAVSYKIVTGKYSDIFQKRGNFLLGVGFHWENLSWEGKLSGGGEWAFQGKFKPRDFNTIHLRNLSYFLFVDSILHMKILELELSGRNFQYDWNYLEVFSWEKFSTGQILQGEFSAGQILQGEFSAGSYFLLGGGGIFLGKIKNFYGGDFRHDLKNDWKLKSFSNQSIIWRIFQVEPSARNFKGKFSEWMELSREF